MFDLYQTAKDVMRQNLRRRYPDASEEEIELWDGFRLTQLLADLGSEGLTRYWFDRTVIRLQDLTLAFKRRRQVGSAGGISRICRCPIVRCSVVPRRRLLRQGGVLRYNGMRNRHLPSEVLCDARLSRH